MIQLPSNSMEMRIMNEICSGIQKQVDEIRQRLLAVAEKEFEQQVRAVIGKVAINIAEYYTIEHIGGNLVITVRINKS